MKTSKVIVRIGGTAYQNRVRVLAKNWVTFTATLFSVRYEAGSVHVGELQERAAFDNATHTVRFVAATQPVEVTFLKAREYAAAKRWLSPKTPNGFERTLVPKTHDPSRYEVPYDGDIAKIDTCGAAVELHVAGELVHAGTEVPFALNLLRISPHSIEITCRRPPVVTFVLFDDLATRRRIALSRNEPYYVYQDVF